MTDVQRTRYLLKGKGPDNKAHLSWFTFQSTDSLQEIQATLDVIRDVQLSERVPHGALLVGALMQPHDPDFARFVAFVEANTYGIEVGLAESHM